MTYPNSIALAMTKSVQKYRYQAINARGKTTVGEIVAQNPALAKALLRKQGLAQITIEPVQKMAFRRSIARQEILLAIKTLATLISAGIVLTQALQICQQNTQNAQLTTILGQIKQDIETGENFATAIGKHQAVFGQLSVALIDAGEKSGTLDLMLNKIATHLETQSKLKATISHAIRYPITVLAVASVVMAVLLLKVVPIFANSFASMGQDLPLITQMVLQLSNLLRAYFWYGLLGLVVFGGVGLHGLLHRPAWQLAAIKKITRLPLIGKLYTRVANARFASTLATTFGAGMILTDALQLSLKATNNPLFITQSQAIIAQVQAGSRLSSVMIQTGLFSPMSVQLVAAGEESGKLTEMLDTIAQYHEQQTATQVQALTAWLEPVMIVGLGLMVGLLILAMYLPIFNMGMGAR